MSGRFYLTGARMVLPEQVIEDGAVLIEDGRIAAVAPAGAHGAREVPLRGQWLLPGLVDLHCDAIEKEAEPRSRVSFPAEFAVAQIDRRNAAAGITTPFHALSLAGASEGVRSACAVRELVAGLRALGNRGLVDNRVHCRYEITSAQAYGLMLELMEGGFVDLISVMDHSPGQGQFKTMEAYLQYVMGNHSLTREQAEAAAQAKQDGRADASGRVERLLARAQELGIPTASHDDDSVHRIATMRNFGVAMSEFPVNLDTATAAVSCGLPTILGAPNVLRGGSQSGSMRAIDGIRAGVASCLCSDYQPSALAAAVFSAAEQGPLPLPQAVALASLNPARACGLADRGAIAAGLRADLVAVARLGKVPVVAHTWSAGRRVFSAGYPD